MSTFSRANRDEFTSDDQFFAESTTSAPSREVEFTNRYRINRLVYYEIFKYVNNCIARETELKGWSRSKKVALINRTNPTWEDLAANWGKPITPLNPECLHAPTVEKQIPRFASE